MALKPINVIQAAESDLCTRLFNQENGQPFREYAFHRHHVRRANTALDILLLALMSPPLVRKKDGTIKLDTVKKNTQLLYGDAKLLVAAIRRLTEAEQAHDQVGVSNLYPR